MDDRVKAIIKSLQEQIKIEMIRAMAENEMDVVDELNQLHRELYAKIEERHKERRGRPEQPGGPRPESNGGRDERQGPPRGQAGLRPERPNR